MFVARCVVVGALLLVAGPVGAVRIDDEDNDLEVHGNEKPTICKASERSDVPQFAVTFAFAPKGGCSIVNCRTPDAVFAAYIHPDNGLGLIRSYWKKKGGECVCKYAENLVGGKEEKFTWFRGKKKDCTPTRCWGDFASRASYTGELTKVTTSDDLDSGNHWKLACEAANVTEPYIEMPVLDHAKELEEEEARHQLEEEETARRERVLIAEQERLEDLRLQQEEADRERLQMEEAERERLRVEEEQRRLQEEAEKERLSLEEEARKQQDAKERERLEELARQKNEEKERLDRERNEAREKAEREKRERLEEEHRREEEQREEEQREEEQRRRIQEEADRALVLAAKAKGITIEEGSWKITLLWDSDNVDLDLHFYEKDWIAGKSRLAAFSAEINFGHKTVSPFLLDLDDTGTRIERRGDYHVENLNLASGSVPDGEYVAYVVLFNDRRHGQRDAIPFQLILKGVNGESGRLACKPKTASQVLACSFDAPPASSWGQHRHDLPEFDFKITNGHLKFKEEQL